MLISKTLRLQAGAAALLACSWTVAAAQVETTAKHGSASHGHTRKPRAAPHPMSSASPAANLNAPSTDFSNVEPDNGETRQSRQNGPNIHPSIDSNGRPVMGLGF